MPISQRDGATSRACRALAVLESEPSPDTPAAARRALLRRQRVADNPRESDAVDHALAYGFDTGDA